MKLFVAKLNACMKLLLILSLKRTHNKILLCSCAVVKSSACLELLLILSEEDVKGASKAPHGEHQEQQEPLDVNHHGAQSVNKSVLGWLKYPVPADSVSTAFRVYKEFTVRTLKSVQSHHGAEEYQQRPSWTAEHL